VAEVLALLIRLGLRPDLRLHLVMEVMPAMDLAVPVPGRESGTRATTADVPIIRTIIREIIRGITIRAMGDIGRHIDHRTGQEFVM
jgi:hypothetical protein